MNDGVEDRALRLFEASRTATDLEAPILQAAARALLCEEVRQLQAELRRIRRHLGEEQNPGWNSRARNGEEAR